MPKNRDRELAAVEDKILEMGGVVQEMIQTATRALIEKDASAIEQLDQLEDRCDRFQVEIDEDVIRLITVYCPVAADLRFCVMTARINTDLERIGDQAINMVQNMELLSEVPESSRSSDIPKMAELAAAMVDRSLRAYKERKAEGAREVIASDDQVDRLYEKVSQEVLDATDSPGKRPLALVLTARALERIADHATNIAEEVIYLVRGEDIRHADALQSVAN